jgi:DNA-binding NtrC family response regulator
VISVGRSTVACPNCEKTITIDPPLNVRGTNVWEVHCSACFRSAMITDARPPTVMIVDNDPSVGGTLETVIRRAGHEVLHFTDAQTALESYHRRPAQVVLLDMGMPDMSGMEFMRKLHREFPDARVIAMAGQRRHGAPDPLASAQRLGAAHTLRKPFTPPELLRVLDSVLGARRGLPR